MELSNKISVYAIPGLPTHERPDLIIQSVIDMTGVDIHAKNRKRATVEARQLAMYILKRQTRLSLAVIGEKCGGKDHATVLHACKTVTNLMNTDKRYKANHTALLQHFKLI